MGFFDRFFKPKEGIAIDSALFEIPLTEARFVVLDTELTGLDEKNDFIVSIGAVKMTGPRIELGDSFYQLVKPCTDFSCAAVTIHGITPSELADKPEIDKVLPELLEFFGEGVIAGYIPTIDMTFINRELKQYFGQSLENSVVDVFAVYKWVSKRNGGNGIFYGNLYEIAESLDIPVKSAHNAISDAFIAAQVLQRLLSKLSDLGVTSLGELLSISNSIEGGGGFKFSHMALSL
jgi:DNA polymerase-3 subunit epsilon